MSWAEESQANCCQESQVFNSVLCYLPLDEASGSCLASNQFECEPGLCVNATLKCNEIADCPSGADEAVDICGCASDEFRCSDSCIPIIERCDKTCNCDGACEDEDTCETFNCLETHFKCNNHFCIPHDKGCDYKDDCGDNSDEDNCAARPCWHGEIGCDNGQCMRDVFFCDGIHDCYDQSDESRCNATYFKVCADGSRVHQTKWCDGKVDCVDEVDEEDCTCAEDEYRCGNGRCMRPSVRCNGRCDCKDCDDEDSCGDTFCDLRNGFVCPFDQYHLYKPACVRKEYICDMHNDCGDWSDEYTCGEQNGTYCNRLHHLPCSRDNPADDPRCIPLEGLCDGQPFCYKGVDENKEYCPNKNTSCAGFKCSNGQCINMAYRCDASADCWDMSDEDSCDNYKCPQGHWKCKHGHCILASKRCDFKPDCFMIEGERDSSDEENCDFRNCAESEFRCENGECIPDWNRCIENYSSGCTDRSHLNNCSNFQCPTGSHKCRNAQCVAPELVCNRATNCLDWSDEDGCAQECSLSLPLSQCECINDVARCENLQLQSLPLNSHGIQGITNFYLSGNYLNNTLSEFTSLERSVLLDLSNNNIIALGIGMFNKLWRLRNLYLENNHILHIQSGAFTGLSNLKSLRLNGNKIMGLEPEAFNGLSQITTLDLSNQNLKELPPGVFKGLHSLTFLNLSNNALEHIPNGAFYGLTKLQILDISSNKLIVIDRKVFYGLPELRELHTDEFRFCCMAKSVENCYPEPDEFSSCENLMSNTFLRMCLWIQGGIAFVGNLFVIIWRVKNKRDNKIHSFLITNLAFGDFCMGVYLLIIATVDAYYRGVYSMHDRYWRESELCKFAGFLSTFSSELSVFSLTIITLHRLSSIMFPFRIKDMEFRGAVRVMVGTWIFVIILAAIPLVGLPYFGNFYGRSGVCLAFHITPDKWPGWEYSVFIFLVVNFFTFGIIAVSYAVMFVVARRTQKAVMRSRDAKAGDSMAQKMTVIVATDFVCWMPIIILGMASIGGAYVPPQVYAWVAVFVLPVNAAINPMMYTLATTPYVRRAFNRARTTLAQTSYSMSIDTKHTNIGAGDRTASKIPNGRKSGWSKGRTSSTDSNKNAFKLRPMLSSDVDSDDHFKSSENLPLKKQDSKTSDDTPLMVKRPYETLSDSVTEQEKTAFVNHEKQLNDDHCL